MANKILAVCFDCGDTIVDEGTEIKDEAGVVLQAGLIPGAADTLYMLKEHGYRLALVADGPAGTFYNVLGHFKLLEMFEALAISDEVGVSKPEAQIFHHALHQLGIGPQDYHKVVMVGNNLERDIKGANQLGLISIWLDWAPRRSKTPVDLSEQPCYTIKMPAELVDILAVIERSLP
jgi:FMN phosphatase YigB (HAD superfamily)